MLSLTDVQLWSLAVMACRLSNCGERSDPITEIKHNQSHTLLRSQSYVLQIFSIDTRCQG